jgi:phospholipase/carboxylesterase
VAIFKSPYSIAFTVELCNKVFHHPINGDLFSHVIAFSPGFMAPKEQHGSPQIFISHGTHDPVLPIDRCSRRIVPQLQQSGYDVHYREFDGPHTVPLEIAREAVDWFVME